MKYFALLDEQNFEIDVEEKEGRLWVQLNGQPRDVDFIRLGDTDDYSLLVNNMSYQLTIEENRGEYSVHLGGKSYRITVEGERERRLWGVVKEEDRRVGAEMVRAPMPGLVVEVEVKEGDTVAKGAGLVIIEAMKMENELKSPIDGVIKEVRVRKGATVEREQLLVVIE